MQRHARVYRQTEREVQSVGVHACEEAFFASEWIILRQKRNKREDKREKKR